MKKLLMSVAVVVLFGSVPGHAFQVEPKPEQESSWLAWTSNGLLAGSVGGLLWVANKGNKLGLASLGQAPKIKNVFVGSIVAAIVGELLARIEIRGTLRKAERVLRKANDGLDGVRSLLADAERIHKDTERKNREVSEQLKRLRAS